LEGAVSCFSLREKHCGLRRQIKNKGKGMASYHCSVKVGGKGKAGPHAEYIARIGKYSGNARFEDCEYTEHANMPGWAVESPQYFWAAADEYERANGATYREIMVALPRELTPGQRIELVRDFVLQEIGSSHPYSLAIHNPNAAIERGEQPHAHIMYNERTLDGIERDPNEFFKRYNAKNPEKGGCKKDSAGTPERLAATRERWANIQNEHLARHGHDVEVDHRSYADQGIDRQPEKHLGSKGIRRLKEQDISALLELRIAQGEKERADQEVKSLIIDLSGDIEAAKQAREREAQLRLERASQRKREREAAEEAQRKREQEGLLAQSTPGKVSEPPAIVISSQAEAAPAVLETVEQYVARKVEQTSQRFTIAKADQRITGPLLKIKNFSGQIYGVVDVGRGDRTLVRHGFSALDVGKMIKGTQRSFGFEPTDRASKGQGYDVSR
jgi:hypothetical protein